MHIVNEKLKLKLVKEYLNGTKMKVLGEKYNKLNNYRLKRPEGIIFEWVARYKKYGYSGLIKAKQIRRKKIKYENLTKEELIEILRIKDELIKDNISKKKKFMKIENELRNRKLSLQLLCDLLDVSKSGYYYWFKKSKFSINKLSDLDKKILYLFNKHNMNFGYRRIYIYLQRDFGIIVNIKTVYRSMNKQGLKAKIRIKKPRTKVYEQTTTYVENLINGNFKSYKPNNKLFTDVSHIRLRRGWAYLSVTLDSYANNIIDWKFSKFNDADFILKNIKSTLSKINTPYNDLIIHSDNGSCYKSKNYMSLINEYKFIPSMSRKGHCLDNRPVEYFFSILKQECLRIVPLIERTFERLENEIMKFINYYHNERIQFILRNKTPIEFLQIKN